MINPRLEYSVCFRALRIGKPYDYGIQSLAPASAAGLMEYLASLDQLAQQLVGVVFCLVDHAGEIGDARVGDPGFVGDIRQHGD